MAPEANFSISMASVVEDVLQQHRSRLSDNDLASRKAEEAGFELLELESILILVKLRFFFLNSINECRVLPVLFEAEEQKLISSSFIIFDDDRSKLFLNTRVIIHFF